MSTKAGRPKSPNKQNQKKQNQQGQAQQFPQSQQPRPTIQTATSQSQLDQAAKRESRLERQALARAAGERRRRKQAIQRYAIVIAALIVVLGGATALLMRELNKPGEQTAFQPSPHVQEGQAHDAYITDPPTSGPHFDNLPGWRVSTTPIVKELLVHGLEDGGVEIHYQPNLDKATVDRLAALATSYIERTDAKNHVVMAPYEGLTEPIVLTSWRRIDRLPAFDEARIRSFVDAYAGIDHHGDTGNH